ncbi:hypothetical protein FS749_011151 [Ceratobasidium sp. UAMH 11750]|nr:hypothetical protein FS749_011151 [Ceratobasidium sp. UAMH 11750]
MSDSAFTAKPFRLTLIQLGGLGADKSNNLAHAREMVMKAVQPVDGKKSDLVVLPECFNSPYGVQHFPKYAETIDLEPGKSYDIATKGSESIKALSAMAKEANVWLLGGSIPERDESDGKLYNTSTVYNPSGDLVALHRKVHLFDIDIPGGITFKASNLHDIHNLLTNIYPRKAKRSPAGTSSLLSRLTLERLDSGSAMISDSRKWQ